jgi:FG-GAP-like repeat
MPMSSVRKPGARSVSIAQKHRLSLAVTEVLEPRKLLSNTISFHNAVEYADNATGTFAVAVADLNGDGKLDIVTANDESDTVSVLLNNGNGTFQPAKTYVVGTHPYSVEIGDLADNGTMDIVTSNDKGADVSVLIGNGDGTFRPVRNYQTLGANPDSMKLAALVKGGPLDIVTGNYGSNSVSVLMGYGNGTFRPAKTYAVGPLPDDIAIAPLTPNANPSIVVANSGSTFISVLTNIGNGTFLPGRTYASQYNTDSVAIGDVNGDGFNDIVTSCSTTSTIQVFLNEGNGVFNPAENVFGASKPPEATGMTLADIDGDGNLDIVEATPSINSVAVLTGNGDGTFSPAEYFSTGTATVPVGVAVGDLNGDGRPDIVTGDYLANSEVSVLLSNSAGPFFTSPNHVIFTEGLPDTFNVTTTAAPVAALTENPSALLSTLGLTFTDEGDGTATLTGTPSLSEVGTYDLTFTATSSAGTATQAFVLTIAGPPTITSGDGFTMVTGTYDAYTVTTSGIPAPSLTETGGLPAGVSFTDEGNGTALLAGTPVPGTGGVYDLTITADNGASPEATQPFTLTVDQPPVITSPSSFTFIDGRTNTFVVTSTGFPTPTLSLTNGTLPTSVTLTPTDSGTLLLTGDPPQSTVGSYTLTFDATNTVAPDAMQTFVLTIANSLASGVSFATPGEIPVGDDPQSVAVGDLAGNGSKDLVVANAQSDTVTVLLSNGNGTYMPAETYAAGNYPVSVALADLNGDGFTDIIVADKNPTPEGGTPEVGTVGVLLGNGDGTFQPLVTFAVGNAPVSVAAADLSGSGTGAPAVVVVNQGDNDVEVLQDYGGGFGSAATFAVGYAPTDVVIASLDGSGAPDLIVSNSVGMDGSAIGTVSVLVGDGSGGFGSQVTFSAGMDPQAVAVGVLGDGTASIVVANGLSNYVSILTGNGPGLFAVSATLTVDSDPDAVAIADVNGDGTMDLVVGARSPYRVDILLGNANGTFKPFEPVPTGNYPGSLAVANLNQDKNLDIVTTDSHDNTVTILLGNGDGTFHAVNGYLVGNDPISMALADLANDGTLDLVVANELSNSISILQDNGDGTFSPQTTISLGVGNYPTAVAIADLNGDGNMDLIVAFESKYSATTGPAGSIEILLGNGGGTFQTATPEIVSLGPGQYRPVAIDVADFNGDGSPDILVLDHGWYDYHTYTLKPAYLVCLLNDGSGNFSYGHSSVTRVGYYANSMAVADFNGDGILDVAVANGISGTGYYGTIVLLQGNGDGSFQSPQTLIDGNYPTSIVAGDFNGDGFVDLAWTDLAAGTVNVMLNQRGSFGSGSFYSETPIDVGYSPRYIAVADVNNDGILDLVVTDGDDIAGVLVGNGDGTFQPPQNFNTGPDPTDLLLADVNGDGKLDILTTNSAGNDVSVLLNTTKVIINSQWTYDGSGNWGTGDDWSNGIPTQPGDAANFTYSGINTPVTVTLQANYSIGELVFNSPNKDPYDIAAGTAGVLTMNGNGASAEIIVQDGDPVISAPLVLDSDTFVSLAAGQTLTLEGGISGPGSLTVSGDGTLVFAGGHNTLSGLTINSGSTVDLGDNALLLDYTSVSPQVAIQNYIADGALVSSFVENNSSYALGYADGADGVVTNLSAGQFIVVPALLGDANLDGSVNIHDLQTLLSNFNSPAPWDGGNFTNHKVVDVSDLQALLTNFNQTSSLGIYSFAELAGGTPLIGQTKVPSAGLVAASDSSGESQAISDEPITTTHVIPGPGVMQGSPNVPEIAVGRSHDRFVAPASPPPTRRFFAMLPQTGKNEGLFESDGITSTSSTVDILLGQYLSTPGLFNQSADPELDLLI